MLLFGVLKTILFIVLEKILTDDMFKSNPKILFNVPPRDH
jgi:hypothetical protein